MLAFTVFRTNSIGFRGFKGFIELYFARNFIPLFSKHCERDTDNKFQLAYTYINKGILAEKFVCQ